MNEIGPDPQALAYVESIPKEKRIFNTLTNNMDTLWSIYHKFYTFHQLPMGYISMNLPSIWKHDGGRSIIGSGDDYIRDVVDPTLNLVEQYLSLGNCTCGLVYSKIRTIDTAHVKLFPHLHTGDVVLTAIKEREFGNEMYQEIISEIRAEWLQVIHYSAEFDKNFFGLYDFLYDCVYLSPKGTHIHFSVATENVMRILGEYYGTPDYGRFL